MHFNNTISFQTLNLLTVSPNILIILLNIQISNLKFHSAEPFNYLYGLTYTNLNLLIIYTKHGYVGCKNTLARKCQTQILKFKKFWIAAI